MLTVASSSAPGDMTQAERRRLLSQATLSIRHTRGIQDGLQKMPFNNLPPETFDSKYIIASALETETKVTSTTYDVCVNGCQAFTGPFRDRQTHRKCGVCPLARLKHVSVFSNMKLGFIIAYAVPHCLPEPRQVYLHFADPAITGNVCEPLL